MPHRQRCKVLIKHCSFSGQDRRLVSGRQGFESLAVLQGYAREVGVLVKRIVIGSPAEENLLADWLNAAGEDGWQLVTHMNFIMILKRRKMD